MTTSFDNTVASVINKSSSLEFGRGTAQFKQLVSIMAVVSITLWVIFLLTMLLRLWARHMRYRHRNQMPLNNDIQT